MMGSVGSSSSLGPVGWPVLSSSHQVFYSYILQRRCRRSRSRSEPFPAADFLTTFKNCCITLILKFYVWLPILISQKAKFSIVFDLKYIKNV